MRRGILIIIALVIIIGAPIAWFIFLSPKKQPSATKEPHGVVVVSGINSHKGDLNNNGDDTVMSIEKNIYSYASRTVSNPKPYYNAIIRSGSYKKTYSQTDDNTPVIDFLVDIPDIKRTYKVDYSGGKYSAEHILYILCPDTDEMIYPTFACQDDVQ